MSWNYRIVRHDTPEGFDGWFGLYEVFYDADGAPTGVTKTPITFEGESRDDIIRCLKMALSDAESRDIFEPPAEWGRVKAGESE